MNYINRRTGTVIELSNLDPRRQEFYKEALSRARKNVPWADFEDYAFGIGSPLYADRTSHIEVLKDPLYQALTEMWVELGVKQGLIAPERAKEKTVHGQRRSEARRRAATGKRNAKKDRELAASHSFAHSHS